MRAHVCLKIKQHVDYVNKLVHFAIVETPYEDGSYCREYVGLVDTWPDGQHQLETRVTFTQDIHDGWNLYPAGTHTFKYFVYVGQ